MATEVPAHLLERSAEARRKRADLERKTADALANLPELCRSCVWRSKVTGGNGECDELNRIYQNNMHDADLLGTIVEEVKPVKSFIENGLRLVNDDNRELLHYYSHQVPPASGKKLCARPVLDLFDHPDGRTIDSHKLRDEIDRATRIEQEWNRRHLAKKPNLADFLAAISKPQDTSA